MICTLAHHAVEGFGDGIPPVVLVYVTVVNVLGGKLVCPDCWNFTQKPSELQVQRSALQNAVEGVAFKSA